MAKTCCTTISSSNTSCCELLFGNGVPPNSLGSNGGVYTDKLTGDVYKKIAGIWVFQYNQKGASGADGDSTNILYSNLTATNNAGGAETLMTYSVPLVDYLDTVGDEVEVETKVLCTNTADGSVAILVGGTVVGSHNIAHYGSGFAMGIEIKAVVKTTAYAVGTYDYLAATHFDIYETSTGSGDVLRSVEKRLATSVAHAGTVAVSLYVTSTLAATVQSIYFTVRSNKKIV